VPRLELACLTQRVQCCTSRVMPFRAFSGRSVRARPDRHGAGRFDSPQYPPANWPQAATAVSASPPRSAARKTAPSEAPAAWNAHRTFPGSRPPSPTPGWRATPSVEDSPGRPGADCQPGRQMTFSEPGPARGEQGAPEVRPALADEAGGDVVGRCPGRGQAWGLGVPGQSLQRQIQLPCSL
jgi:hypothetical protein